MKSTVTTFGIALVTLLLSINSCKCAQSSKGQEVQKQLLVGYWGQNSAGSKLTDPAKYEKSLDYFCLEHKYDIIVIGFIVPLFHQRHKDELPGINLSHHCGFAANRHYPFLYKCSLIERYIKECQRSGTKVTISIGGSTMKGDLGSSDRALKLAYNLWNLYLAGKDTSLAPLRPFGSAVLDGVDLDVEQGSFKYYPIFVQELHRLMSKDSSKQYIISAAPQCPYPDHVLGPEVNGTALKDAGEFFNHVYIQYYNNFCWPGDMTWFNRTLTKWLNFGREKGVDVFIGLPAGIGASSESKYYLAPSKFKAMYKSVRHLPGLGGVMLWDCSWDQNNILENTSLHYSDFVHNLLLQGNDHVTKNITEETAAKSGNKNLDNFVTSYLISITVLLWCLKCNF